MFLGSISNYCMVIYNMNNTNNFFFKFRVTQSLHMSNYKILEKVFKLI